MRYRPLATITATRVSIAARLARTFGLVMLSFFLATCRSDKGPGPSAPPTNLGILTDPTTTTAGVSIAPSVTVIALDASGKMTPGYVGSVTLAISAGTGTSGATLSGPTTVVAKDGVATFTDLSINRSGIGYRLQATANGLSPVTTAAFDITPGAAAKLVFTDEPDSAMAGAFLTTQVTAQDALGNTATAFTGAVTMAITAGTGTSGATLSGTATVPADAGVASFSTLSIDKAGTNYSLSATATSLTPDTSASFNIVGGAAWAIVPCGGDGQTDTVGTAVATPPSVCVVDQFGNSVAGEPVTFVVASGGGSITGAVQTANASGIATVGSWTLGTTAGANTLTATSGTLAGSPLTFSATGTADAPTQVAPQAGDGQSAIVATAVATPPAVIVRDQYSNPVAGVEVTFAVASGGGTVSPATVLTDANGIAAATWTLGNSIGPNTLTATAGTLAGSPITFTANAKSAVASSIAIASGDGQTATVGTAVAAPPAVIVRDQHNNPVEGVTVTFAVTSGGGSITGATQTTNAAGIARVGSWTLGTTAGANTLTATSGTLAGSPLSFTATGTPGIASSIAISAGNGQSATVGTAVAAPPAVIVRDQHNNLVPGVAVTFAVASGGGSITGATPTTNLAGIATVGSWTLGTTAGPNTLVASAGALTVTFTATGTAGVATQVALQAGDGQTAGVGTAVAIAPAVFVGDQFNNPVAGVTVTFAVTSGGGSVTGATQTTDGAGIARVGSWTLGTTAGSNTLAATSGTLAGSPVTFSAIGVPDGNRQIAINAGDGQTATVGTAVAIAVIVRDQFSNPVAGVAVTFAVTTGGGTVSPATPVLTDANGIAATTWTLGTTAGANSLTATANGLAGSPVTFSATGTAGAATQVALQSGDGQTATVGTAVAITPAVIVRDQFNNPVAGVAVTFAVASGGGTASPATPVLTDANGIAAATSWTLGNTVGPNTLSASADGLTGSPVTFSATGTVGVATQIVLQAGDGQTAIVGTAVAIAPAVLVRDQFNNPVAGVAVTFAVATGGGTVSPPTPVLTDASGIAALAFWTVGTSPGSSSLAATADGLAGSPVTFTATVTTDGPSQIALQAGDGQTATVGTAVATPPSVLVRDVFNNPIAGVPVTFAVTAGGGTVSPATPVLTDANGIAVTAWTLGNTAGSNSLTATAGTLTGSPVSFSATGTAAAATQITLQAGDGQTATVATAVAIAPAVIVRDQFNNPVAGVAVTFAIATGAGTVDPATPVLTDASGIAAATSWTLGNTAGANSLTATADGLAGSPVNFSATGTTGSASSIALQVGDGQAATVGTAVAIAPTVIVRDQLNNPVAGVAVTFAVTAGGGTVSPATPVLTDANGIAVTAWTLGNTAGSNSLTATADGLAGSPVSFTATGTAAAATQIALQAGDGQTATVATAVVIAPAVIVRDQFNNPVAGVAVTFAVATGAGTVDPATPVMTDASGIAAATSWTLGPTAGANSLTASADGLAGSPVSFSATGMTGSASSIALQTGDGQAATVGTAVAIAPAVLVRDQLNNPVAGVAVTFAVTAGAGTVDPATPVLTDANGIAAATSWTLGNTAGANSLSATADGLAGSPVSFTATGTAAAATQIALQAGDAQAATVATAVAIAPAVLVRDQFNNPVAGVAVTFAIATGAGTVDPATPVLTDASGIAAATSWTLGNTAGANSLTATADGLAGSPVSFTATGTTGSASSIALQTGDGQTTIVGTAVAIAPTVIIRDQFNNPVAGVAVTFAVAAGGGTVDPTTPVTTDANGIAAATSWTLGNTAGAHTLTATADGLTGSPVSFSATGTASTASSITLQTGDGQAATVGTAVAIAPAVIVRDQFNNPVAGVAVTFAVAAGGGTVDPTTPVTTDANGIAAATSWTLGTSVGSNSLTATADGLAGSPVSFSATGTASAATQVALQAGDGQTAIVGTALAIAPAVIVRDQFNNPVAGVAVTFAVTSGGGTVSPTTPVLTDASGIAALAFWTVGGPAGTNSLTATADGLAGSPVTFTATGHTNGPSQIALQAGDGQTATVGTAVATPPTVLVRDVFNNPIAGVPVTFAVTAGGGTVSPATPVLTDANGIAVTAWTLGNTAGSNSLTATAGTLIGSPVSFSATGIAGNASSIALQAGDGQTATVGTPVAIAPVVLVRDQFNNPVAGVAVTFAIVSGGGTADPATPVLTDASGIAAATSWTLGNTAGPNTLSASVDGLTGSPVTFSATGTAGNASSIALQAGDGQAATVGTAVAIAPAVLVRDQFNNPVAGAAVTFAVTAGAGTVDPATPVLTDASGIAAATSWTLGNTAGANALSASADGLTGSPVSFSATGTAAAATQVALQAGDGQTATVATAVAIAPAVIVRDQFNNPVAGVPVTFVVASGAGTVDPATPVLTDASGIAALTSWTLGNTAGANALTASVDGLAGSPVNFSATGTAGTASSIALQAGDAQTATIGTAVGIAPAVLVRDQFNNPVAGVAVTFDIATGGGTVNPPTPVLTDGNGIAAVAFWTVGTSAGSNTLSATADGLAGSPVTFSATGTAGNANLIALQAGDGQTATVGTAVAIAPAVIVRDQFNNPVAGVPVTFAIATGGGSVSPATPVLTDASGTATATFWTLGNTAGANSLTATSAGLTGSPVSFSATGTAGTASSIALQAGDAQTSTVATAVAIAPAVLVRDQFNNPVAGVAVTFAVASGAGTVDPATPVMTDANGIAAATSWTLGNTAGANALSATADGLAGSPISFSATGTAGTASSIALQTGDAQAATVATTVAIAPAVLVRDQFNNPVAGVAVTFAIAMGAGTVDPATPVLTDASGIAAATSWTLGTTAGANSLTATADGLAGSPVNFSATGTTGTASSIALQTGSGQAATVGTAVAIAPTVIIRDQFNNPVAGVAVTFAVAAGGGMVDPTTPVLTDATGIAAATSWTLGNTAGAHTLTASADGLTGSPVSFSATGTAAAATQVALQAGDAQTATVATAVAIAPAVLVRDQFNNPVAGVAVTFGVTAGGGTVDPGTPVLTDANGIAAATSWTLGNTVGANTLSASADGLAGSPVSFSATGTAATASSIALQAGDGQTATVATAVAIAPAVLVRDQFNNPVAGVAVTFAVTAGGGTVDPATSVLTDATGIAAATSWTLGNSAGANTLTASADGLTGSPVAFNATGTAAAATQVALQAGDAQTATVATAVGIAPAVLVRDQFNNPVAGVAVTFAVTAGAGAVSPTTPVTTDANGIAAATSWTLGNTAGANALSASADGLTGSPVSFSATGTAAAATQVALQAGDGQTATVATAVAIAPAVIVRDQFNNPVAGVPVTFVVASGAGTVDPATPVLTDASGIAALTSWTLGNTAGANALTASVDGLAGSPVSFSATATAGTASSIALQAGDAQTATVATAVAIAPAVLVRDQFNNPVAGVAVTFAVTAGAGTVDPATPVMTDASGIAAATSWTLGNTAGANTLSASADGLAGSPVSFNANGTPAAATQVALQAGDAQTATVATAVAIAPAVIVRDQFNNPVAGVEVTFAVASGDGSVTGATQTTNVGGIATIGSWTLGNTAGANSLTATSAGLTGSPATFSATGTSGAATQVALQAGDGQTATVATAVAIAPAVLVRDQFNNPVAGVAVTFAVTAGAGTVDPATPVMTDANGLAAATSWTLGNTAGANALSASADGLTGSPVSFTATSTAGTASSIALQAGDAQTATVATAVAIAPAVIVRDQFNNPVAGVAVTFAVTAGAGTVSPTTPVTTDASGIAAATSWTLGNTAGVNALSASADGLAGSPVSFSAMGTAAAATQVALQAGDAQTATVATAVAIAPAVVVRDQFNNPVAGVAVTFAVTAGAGTVDPATPVITDANGIAAATSWTLGATVGPNTLTAAAGALAGSPVTFNAIAAAGAATQLVFSVEPSSATAGAAIAPAVQVTARDQFGNTAVGFTGNVTMAIGTNPSAGTLSGTTSVAAVAGVAIFSSLSIDKVGTGYTLSATSTGLTGVTSAPFSVTAGAAAELAFTVQPTTTTAGVSIAPDVQVTALDAFGNIAVNFNQPVAVAITVGTGSAGATLTGVTNVAAVSGVATFSGLSINRSGSAAQGTGYTLSAFASGVLSGTSSGFDILTGAASQVVFNVQPSTATAGVSMAPAVEVTAQDASGNTVTTFTGNVTVALGANPAGGLLSGTMTAAAIAGTASFSNLSINKVGTYTLAATASGLSGATSVAFDITPGAATELVYSVQPSTATSGGAIAPPVRVTARDALGNVATGFIGNITVSIGTNPAGGALSGTTTVAAIAGVATFSTLSIDLAGTGYTLTATNGLPFVVSAPFDVIPSTPTQLVFIAPPGQSTSGAPITPAVQVAVRDAAGNTVTSFTGDVTVALGTNPVGGLLSGTKTVAAIAGVATFSSLSIDKAASGYTLVASSDPLTSATSAPFTVIAGAATELVFAVQPSAAAAGAVITPQVEVMARDAHGNTATGFTENVTVAFGSNPAGGTLSGLTQVAAVAGVAAFSTLSINTAGTYTLAASATGLTAATSASFTISAGAPSRLVFTVQPSATTAGASITPAVAVTAQDALGNTVTGFTGNVTLTITSGTGTSGAVLSGTTTVAAVSGVATFSTLSIDKSGVGYTMSATAPDLTGATSAAFTIVPGAASQLAFTVQPSVTEAGTIIAPAVQVTAQDALGNTAPDFAGNVSVALAPNAAGGTMSGVMTVGAIAGVATFSSLTVDIAASGYTLLATATGLTGATSSQFTVTVGTATRLAFTVAPSSATAGTAIAPQVEVTALDAGGNLVPNFAGSVTVAIGTNPGAGTLSGTVTVSAVGGVAAFSTLRIDKVGSGYTLSATAPALLGATSATFDITPATAAALSFTVQPSTTTASATITPPIRVSAVDAFGNVATSFTGNVTVAIGANPVGGDPLTGTRTFAAIAGVATFPNLRITVPGNGFTLTAAASGLAADTSAPFDILPSTAAQLFFTKQPAGKGDTVTAGTVLPPVEVTARNVSGQTVTSFTGEVTLAFAPGTCPSGATLLGTTTVNAVAGVATFSTLSIQQAGPCELIATSPGLPTAFSAFFSVLPAAPSQLAFIVQPSTATAAATITPQVEVTVRDAFGNTVTGFTSNVTVAIGTNPAGGTLSGNPTVAAVAGIAAFTNLSINQAGSGYTLVATRTGLTSATSAPFDITATLAPRLVFTVQPTATQAGLPITPAVQVTARDAAGLTITTFTGDVTVAIPAGAGPNGATLSGTTTVAAVGGVATFSDLSIDKRSNTYRLSATASGLAGTTSALFSINPGPAAELNWTVHPNTATNPPPGSENDSTVAGQPFTPPLEVAVLDAFRNPVSNFTGNVTVAFAVNPGAGTLSGTTTVAAPTGVATFPGVSVNRTETGYRLEATSTGLSPDTSDAFTILPAPATHLVFTVQPSNRVAGLPLNPRVRVAVHDALGNVVINFTGSVTVAITPGTGTSGAVLSGSTTVAVIEGVALFDPLSINLAGTGYTLSATASGLAGATSLPFNITPASATLLVFTVQPTATIAGDPIAPAVVVTARDAFGNTATAFTGNVTIGLTAGTGTPGANLSGTKTVAAINGVATFSTLSVNRTGTDYTLGAQAGGLTGATSVPFNVTPGAATQLVFTAQPVTTTAGAIMLPVQVAVRDSLGNTVTGFAAAVTLTISPTANPGGGTLGGTTTVTPVGGVATFSDLSINNTGTGYRLLATSGSLTRTSQAFSIN